MSDVTNRREILKAAAALPFAIAVAPFKALIPIQSSPKHTDLVAKFAADQFSSPGSFISFQMQPHHLPPAVHERITGIIGGYATRLPSGEVVAYSSMAVDGNCSYVYLSDPEQIKQEFKVETSGPSLACKCHGKVFDIHQQTMVAGVGDEPARLRVKHCHNKVCIISDLGDVTA